MTRRLFVYALLLTAFLTFTLAHAVKQPHGDKAACKAQCLASPDGDKCHVGDKIKPAKCHLPHLIRACRKGKPVCATTTTTTTTTSTSTTSTTTTTPVTTVPPTTAGAECPVTGCLHELDFTNGLAGNACGEIDDGAGLKIRDLTCGGLNLGGGGSTVAEGPTPDGSTSRFALVCGALKTGVCTIQPSTTPPAPQSADPDCTATGCNFGTPLPIPNPTLPNLSTCVLNTWATDATGTIDLDHGDSVTAVPLHSDTYLTGNLVQPCPACRAGTCDRGINQGLPCATQNSNGYTRDCPPGGVTPGHPCIEGGIGTCADLSAHVGILSVSLSPLTTGIASMTAADGNFCPGQGGSPGTPGCFNHATCRTITETGATPGAITIGTPIAARLAAVFCIPATPLGLVNYAADLPGPGAVTLPGTFTVR